METYPRTDFRAPYRHPDLLAGLLGSLSCILAAFLLCLAMVAYHGETPLSWSEVFLQVGFSMFFGLLVHVLVVYAAVAANNRAWNAFVLQMEQLEADQKLDPESRLRLEMIRHQKPGEYLYFGPMPAPTEESHAARTH